MTGRVKRLVRAATAKARQRSGQMTVELATVLPVALAIMAIVCNGMAFFSECAAFDRLSRNAVRLYATVPAYGEAPAQAEENIRQLLQQRFSAPNQTVAVAREDAGGYSRYTATITFAPTLFGINLRQEVFGVPLPTVSHSTSLVVDTYKPGMLL